MDTGLTPRRIGRLIGQLDDQFATLSIHIANDSTSGSTNVALAKNIQDYLRWAYDEAENLVSRLNAKETD
jgi:hypothetical protein